jgi:hypothetical protein
MEEEEDTDDEQQKKKKKKKKKKTLVKKDDRPNRAKTVIFCKVQHLKELDRDDTSMEVEDSFHLTIIVNEIHKTLDSYDDVELGTLASNIPIVLFAMLNFHIG